MLTPRKITSQVYLFTWGLLIAFTLGMVLSPDIQMIETLSITVSVLALLMLAMANQYEWHRKRKLMSMTEKEKKDFIARELSADYKVSSDDAEAIIKRTNGAYALQGALGQCALSFAKFKCSWDYYMTLDEELRKMRERENINASMKYSRNGIEIYALDENNPFKKTVIKTVPKGSIDKREFKMFSR